MIILRLIFKEVLMASLLTNKWLWIPLATWLLVQIFKLIVEIVSAKDRKINFKRVLRS